MQIVIELNEELYNYMKSLPFNTILETIVLNGTLLSKGHGRLIDADALEVSMGDDWKTGNEITNCIKSAPTIIEAYKGE